MGQLSEEGFNEIVRLMALIGQGQLGIPPQQGAPPVGVNQAPPDYSIIGGDPQLTGEF